jgi:2-dehydro-3-deoxygalactonokinase
MTSAPSTPAPGPLIGVDWGNSNLRAFRFDARGAVIDQRQAPSGILNVEDQAFETALGEVAGDWLDGPPPTWLLCGAIGSRQGWREVAYVPCPADETALIGGLAPLPNRLGPAWIVPGVSFATPDRAEVMRGEETQMLGALAAGHHGVVVAPGTHSKWVSLQAGAITGFRSFMTGELFAVLKTHSILGALMAPGGHDAEAFDLGAGRALADPAITSLVLTARAEGLFGRIAAASIESYLSGLLIGAEVRGGLAECGPRTMISLIGSSSLTALDARALALAGRPGTARTDGAVAVAQGLWRIGRTLVGAD